MKTRKQIEQELSFILKELEKLKKTNHTALGIVRNGFLSSTLIYLQQRRNTLKWVLDKEVEGFQ